MSYEAVYEWVDGIPLTRVRKNFGRDFSDACLLAEYQPLIKPSPLLTGHQALQTKLKGKAHIDKGISNLNAVVDLHNYREALSAARKIENWVVLNQKVLKRHLGIELAKADIESLCAGTDKAAEKLLVKVKKKIEEVPAEKRARLAQPHQNASPQAGGAAQAEEGSEGRKASGLGAIAAIGGGGGGARATSQDGDAVSPYLMSPAHMMNQKEVQRDFDMRKLLLELADQNLSQFDLHKRHIQDVQMPHGGKEAQRKGLLEVKLPRVGAVRGGGGGDAHVRVLPQPPAQRRGAGGAAGMVVGRERGPAAVKDLKPGAMQIVAASPIRDLTFKARASPQKKYEPYTEVGGGWQGGGEDDDARSRDLMRDSALALAEVRSTYASLEQAVKLLEEAARKTNALPQRSNGAVDGGAGGLWDGIDSLGVDGAGLEGIYGELHDYPWFNPEALPRQAW